MWIPPVSSKVPRSSLLVSQVYSGPLTPQGSPWKSIWITITCSTGPHDDISEEITSFPKWPIMISYIVFWDNAVFITLFTSIPIQTQITTLITSIILPSFYSSIYVTSLYHSKSVLLFWHLCVWYFWLKFHRQMFNYFK